MLESPGSSRAAAHRLPTAPSVVIHHRDGLRGSPSPRPGLHAPPPCRFATVGGSHRRGGAAPSRHHLLLVTSHSRSARAPTLPLTAGALLLGPSDLSAGPASSRAGGCPAMESGRDNLSSHLLIFPSVLDRGKEIREGGGSSLGAPEIVPHGSFVAADFFFRSKIGLRRPAVRRRSSSTLPKDEVVAAPSRLL